MTRRYRRDLRPVGPSIRRALGRSSGSAGGAGLTALRAAWERAAGAAVAACSQPVRRTRAGVVTIACVDGAWAQELSARAEELTERLREATEEPVARLRFSVADHAVPSTGAGAPPPPRPAPDADETRRAEELVGPVEDPRLRTLLRAATAAALARARSSETPGK